MRSGGDTATFLTITEEINLVVRAAREHGIEVHAIHNHHPMEKPPSCSIFMPSFAVREPAEVIQESGIALDQTNSVQE